jgi:hypothetical protein
LEIQPVAIAKLPIGSDVKEMTHDKSRMMMEAGMTNDNRAKARFGVFAIRTSSFS